MKRIRKLVGLFLVIAMALCLSTPSLSVDAASSSKVSVVYKGKTTTYSKKKTSIAVNGKNISISNTPIFMKSGSYVGPAYTIFKKSSLAVGYKENSNDTKLTITYKKHILQLTSGSKTAVIDGKKTTLGTAPIYATYKSSGKDRWIVPIKSICSRLGITYKLSSSGKITLTSSSTSTSTTATAIDTSANSGKIVICLDAGHGGSDSGATNKAMGKAEKNMTLAIVRSAKKYFDKDSRFKVYYTRTSDTYPSLDGRCVLANKAKADLFICVHINSGPSTATGTETLYSNLRNTKTKKGGITSYQLASYMQKVALKSTGFKNRGLVKRNDLRVLKKTNMPACLIEYGFISNKVECTKMNANLSRYGKELYQGIVSFMKSKGKI